MAAVDEGFAQVQFASSDQIVGEFLQHAFEHARLHPSLEPTEARRVRRVASRHVAPGRTGPKHPQDAVENIARISPRATATVVANLRLRQQLLDSSPLLIGQVHPDLRSQQGLPVDRRRIPIESPRLTLLGL